MGTGWELTQALKDKIFKYASYPQTPISLRQMVQFGPSPSPGSIFLASKFIVEELPIRLAKKVKDLENAPLGLNEMPSTIKVKNWYAQSFQELTELHKPTIDENLAKLLYKDSTPHHHQQQHTEENLHTEPEPIEEFDGQEDNPSISNVFSDDGIIIRKASHHHHPHHHSDVITTTESATSTVSDSPTYGMTYFHPCPTNIVWPKEVYDYNKLVRDTLEVIKKRHDATVATMAQGVQEWKNQNKTVLVNSQIQSFLDRFYMSRIGIRMLIGQHIALNMAQSSPTMQRISSFMNGSKGSAPKKQRSNYVGVVCTDSNVREIAEDAIETARYVCEEHYGLFQSPDIELIAPEDVHFTYVPGHLIHILFEVLKNSLRATIEFHTPKLKKKMMEEDPKLKYDEIDINDLKFPPIKVIIGAGSEDITIKISDEGGGIPRSSLDMIWTYLYTTIEDAPKLSETGTSFQAPMAGFGYGLPISRLYAKYFGGDMKLMSIDGFGTDVYIHLNNL
ncbi:pkp1 Pyruvate dehydrogenase [Candida maltosa Xu316]